METGKLVVMGSINAEMPTISSILNSSLTWVKR